MKPLLEIKNRRHHLFKDFLLVAVLSSGISLVANAISRDFGFYYALIPGLMCVLIVAIIYFVDYFSNSSYETSLETLIITDEKNHVIPINRFEFSEDLFIAFQSVISENKTYESLWRDAFSHGIEQGKNGKAFVVEFMEYLFIRMISLELNSYFTNVDAEATEGIGRDQMPDVLIKNRVIEMISKPFQEREKFQRVIKKDDEPKGKVVYMGGEDGALFEELEIELPRKSKVCKKGNSLVIKNRNFNIVFDATFDGFSGVTPPYFEDFYMKRSIQNTNCHMVSLRMGIQVKPLLLFSMRDRQYLGWLDQISDEFINYFSFDKFLQRIDFEGAVTNHILFLNGLNRDEDNNKQEDNSASLAHFRIEKVELDN